MLLHSLLLFFVVVVVVVVSSSSSSSSSIVLADFILRRRGYCDHFVKMCVVSMRVGVYISRIKRKPRLKLGAVVVCRNLLVLG